MVYHGRRWDDEADAWVEWRRPGPTDRPAGRCSGCARALPALRLRRDRGRRSWVCLDCLAARDRPVVERALALAAEALAWPGGRVSLAITPHADDCALPLARWPVVLRLERYRGSAKVDAFDLAECRDLVDRYATMALITRALIALEG